MIRALLGRWSLLVLALAVTGLIGVVALDRQTPVTADADEGEIKHVIERAFLTRGEACITGNVTRTLEFQDLLADLWSDAAPVGATLEARQTQWLRQFITPEPTFQAAYYATAIAEGVISGSLEYWLGRPEAEPLWEPESSPLELQQAKIESCSADYGWRAGRPSAFGVVSFVYQSIEVQGDDASVEVDISYYVDYRFPDDTVSRVPASDVYSYVLVRTSGGWRLVEESEAQPRIG
jgi:hypothetical protein